MQFDYAQDDGLITMIVTIRELYPIRSGQGISEDFKARGREGENYKHGGNRVENNDRKVRILAGEILFVERPYLIDIRHGGTDEENGYIHPVGRFAYHTVVGVENGGDQNQSEKYTFSFDTPEVLTLAKEESLEYRKGEHRPEE